MAKAVWQGTVIADADTVEGNTYFPMQSLRREYLKDSPTTTVCPWKGTASDYTVAVDGVENADAAWYYPDPKPAAENIKNHVAFWREVEVTP